MLTAKLRRPFDNEPITIGPVEYLRLSGKFLSLPDGRVVAMHEGGFWLVQEHVCLAMRVDQLIHLEFEHPEYKVQERLGPYPAMQIIDSAVWAGDACDQVVAIFEEPNTAWHVSLKPTIPMPQLTLRPAG